MNYLNNYNFKEKICVFTVDETLVRLHYGQNNKLNSYYYD